MKKLLLSLLLVLGVSCSNTKSIGERWSTERIWQWYDSNEWFVGTNFNPSYSINQLEFWQAETFDIQAIDRELGWSAAMGMNIHRVYLHNLLWDKDSEKFLDRVDEYLEVADRHGIKTMFVLMDDCWNPVAKAGKQPKPQRHRHNSGWLQSPGAEILGDTTRHNELEPYVKGVMSRFADDERVACWDVYNEPGNVNSLGDFPKYEVKENKHIFTLALLKKVFRWAREVNPSQPLTSGVWAGNVNSWGDPANLGELDKFMVENSDFISFHDYGGNMDDLRFKITQLQKHNRPIICTEYMARTTGNTFQKVLPILKEYNIGAINWGFVSGKSNTIFPWASWNEGYTVEGDEPELWFHDVLRADGTPFDQAEVDFITEITNRK